jgi:RNA polymerase sigma-70 factor (ECF subfamily)
LQNITDYELIKRAKNKQGNPASGAEAIGELYYLYQEAVFRYICSRVSNPQLAEDLTGEVFTRMVINLPKYHYTGAPFLAWLYRIARNLVIDNHRSHNARNHLPIDQVENLSTSEMGPALVVENQIFIEQIRSAIQELKPYKREVLILRFLVGLSLNEVASILDKTISSIKVTQHRALKEVRTILDSHTGEIR